MYKFIAQVLSLAVFGVGGLILEVSAQNNFAGCLSSGETASIQSSTSENQVEYYLVNVQASQIESYPNVFKLNRDGSCQVAVDRQNIRSYPLTNFLGAEIAHALLVNKYQKIMNELGGKEAFVNALIDELDAGTPHPFFYDQVNALKSLGVNLEEIDSYLVIVGKEGMPAHPELNHQD